MVTRAVLFFLALSPALFAKRDLRPLPEPPRAEQIGQFILEHSHTQPTKAFDQAALLCFLKEGTFATGPETQRAVYSSTYANAASDRPTAGKGAAVFCRGAVATKSGEVFLWRLIKERVLELEDHQHRVGWLILAAEGNL